MFRDLNGSTLFNNLAAQYPGSNGVSQSFGFGGAATDTVNTYPHQGTITDPLTQSDLRNEIDQTRAANPSWGDGSAAVYFIYTGLSVTTCFDDMPGCSSGPAPQPPRKNDYCGYHDFYQHGVFGPYVTFAHIPDSVSWPGTPEAVPSRKVEKDLLGGLAGDAGLVAVAGRVLGL